MAKARLPANWSRSARDALLPAGSAAVVEERHGSESWWGGEIRQRQSSQQQADSCSALTGTRRSKCIKACLPPSSLPSWLTPILLQHMQSSASQIAWEVGAGVPPYYGIISRKSWLPSVGGYRTYSINPCRHTLSKSTLGQPACTMSMSAANSIK